jgi:hypothetical protein
MDKTFLYRLLPPRPTFPADMTPAEGAAMQRHFAYWAAQIERGTARVVGPVFDPKGTYGIGILTVPDAGAARALCEHDPVLEAKLGFSFELHEMPDALVGSAAG